MNYPLRKCPHCSNMISNISKRGNILAPDKYRNRKCCTACQVIAVRVSREVHRPVLDSPLDNFIYGKMT